MKRVLLALGLLLGSAASVAAQTGQTVIQGRDATSGIVVPNVADTTTNAIRVVCIGGTCAGSGGLGTLVTDNTIFIDGASSVSSGGVFNDNLALLASGRQATVRLTASRAFHVNLRDSAGNEFRLTPANTPAVRADPALVVAISPSSGLALDSTLAALLATLRQQRVVFGRQLVDGSGVVQPVSNAGIFAVQCTSGCAAGVPGQQPMTGSSPVVIASDQSAVTITHPLVQVAEFDIVNPSKLLAIAGRTVDAIGTPTWLPLPLSQTGGAVQVSLSGTTVDVNVVSSGLPAGASTSALQTTGNTSLGTIKTNTDSLVASGAGGYVRQDSTATIAKESGGNLATIAGKDFATQTTLALIKAKTDNLDVLLSTRTKPSDTQAVSAAALPLPANAAIEAGGNLASVKTNTDPLVAAGAGGYVRQDSTATIAKESGGNLATVATNSALQATAANQTTEIARLTTIASPVGTAGAAAPAAAQIVAGTDSLMLTRPIAVDASGALMVMIAANQVRLPLQPCNPVRRTNCAPKGY